MFKRPIIRRRYESTQFVTETLANGAQVSKWVPVTPQRRVPTGTPGVVGSLVDKMHAGADIIQHARRQAWTPPNEYEFIAQQLPVAEREAYIDRCEAWFTENPRRVAVAAPEVLALDYEAVARVFAKHAPQLPPLDERLAAYHKAGYSAEYIERAKERAVMLEETSGERQKALDLIFAKWPAASKAGSKAVPKKGKVIKAVKKRMPGQDA
jgi:hypothetical protein